MEQTNLFKKRINKALNNPQYQQNFRAAMNYLTDKRAAQFTDDDKLQALREKSAAVRINSLNNLPDLLIKLERNLQKNGINVHWARDGDEANAIIYDILSKANAKTVVKGKSMVSEEIELNHYLIDKGIETLETDLGEFLVQLDNDTPSHIVMPAIHKNKKQISELFHKHFPDTKYTEDVDELTQLTRQIIRDKFRDADAGISGVNFAIADTGTLCLVENEGNGRMCTTLPPLHIAVTGIEKVVEKLTDVAPLLDILTKSATGQNITTYFNMISSARKQGEKDGPNAVHLVLLDNSRSHISIDDDSLDVLRCIRCGSCINHCPVYVKLGGHAYDSVYPGPIGTVLEPMRIGIDKIGTLTSACTMCGACAEVCPVKIPLPKLINKLRADAVDSSQQEYVVKGSGSMKKPIEAKIWKVWAWVYSSPKVYYLLTMLLTKMRYFVPTKIPGWSKYRAAQKPEKTTLAKLASQQGFTHE